MSQKEAPEIGAIIWTDLTVKDAGAVGEFYRQVVGWSTEPVQMGDYADFNMNSPTTGRTIAGVCHARGVNSGLPAQWLVYITVADLDESIARCRELGGKVIHGPRGAGQTRFCVIQDPAGAVAALIEPAGA